MAEAIARGLGEDRVMAYSAGLAPTGRVAAGTLDTLQRLGYPVDGLASKGLEEVPLEDMDVIVSLIGPAALGMLPPGVTARRIAWSIRDPYGDARAVYDAVASVLELRIRELLDDVLLSP